MEYSQGRAWSHILTTMHATEPRTLAIRFVLNSVLIDMDFLEALTEGLERVLMVRGGGKEVITIYS